MSSPAAVCRPACWRWGFPDALLQMPTLLRMLLQMLLAPCQDRRAGSLGQPLARQRPSGLTCVQSACCLQRVQVPLFFQLSIPGLWTCSIPLLKLAISCPANLHVGFTHPACFMEATVIL